MPRAADPTLVTVGPEGPLLRGTQCTNCGAIDFPPLRWGCQRCGAPDCGELELATAGLVLAAVTVAPPKRDAYALAEIALDAGPVIHALIDADVSAGDRVSADWAAAKLDADGEQLVEPRFRRCAP